MASVVRVASIRVCPACRKGAMRAVHGGLGRMGACHKCGYTGPLFFERPKSEVGDGDG